MRSQLEAYNLCVQFSSYLSVPTALLKHASTSAGPGDGAEHLFYYPDKDQENYAVTQYVNADVGAKGLAEIVKEISAKAIKVSILLGPAEIFSLEIGKTVYYE